MPLPIDTRVADWPPKKHAPILEDIDQWSAWYAGQPNELIEAAKAEKIRPVDRLKFWLQGRNPDGTIARRSKLHVPLAGEIAAKSADLLFGEPATFTPPDGDDNQISVQQATLETLGEQIGLDNRLLEAAEIGAALGGVYLRPVWDEDVADHPLLTAVHPDRAVPDFTFGRLAAVTFWEVVAEEGNTIWRHLERHEPGVILHGLYKGDRRTLGVKMPLDTMDATGRYADELALEPELSGRLLPAYIPNMLPNPKHRQSPQGRADIARSGDLLDALDETWSSWMRDIRLGAARLIVPDSYLDRRDRGEGASFDANQEVFTPLSIDPTASDAQTITPIEFKIRAEEHQETVTALVSTIVTKAGYAPETFGVHEAGPAESGRALTIRQGQSWRTKGKKEGYWRQPLGQIWETLLAIDRYQLANTGAVEPFRPTVTFGDAVINDPRETAETVDLLRRAEAISTKLAVRMVNPELSDGQVDDEVDEILREAGRMLADPAGFGD